MGKIGNPPPPQIVGKLKTDYLFSSQKRTYYLFSAFSRSEYLFQQNASPLPLRIKWSSPNCVRKMEVRHLGKSDEQETRAMLAAGQCRCRIEFWPHWISTRGVLIQRALLRIQRIFHVELRPLETGGHCITTLRRIKFWPPLNCDPGFSFHVELWPQVLIPRWILTPESWFNF